MTKKVLKKGDNRHDREAAAEENWVTINELAELFDCTPRHVDLLAQRGIIARVRHGKFDLALSIFDHRLCETFARARDRSRRVRFW